MTMYSGKRKMATCVYSSIEPRPMNDGAGLPLYELVVVCSAMRTTGSPPRVLKSEFPCLVCQAYTRDPHKCTSPERRKGQT